MAIRKRKLRKTYKNTVYTCETLMKFSIIVIAHKRKEYIFEALKSITNQNIPRDTFEVIVVKNFVDKEIDEFIQEIGGANFLSNQEGLAGKIKIGLETCKGEYICFLEDDDCFVPQKLSSLWKLIDINPDLDYIHNGHIVVTNNIFKWIPDKNNLQNKGFILEEKSFSIIQLVSKSFHFNLSSITISHKLGFFLKDHLPSGFIHVVDISILFYAMEITKSKIYFSNLKLTYFRKHNSSHLFFGNLQDFCDFENSLSELEIKELNLLKQGIGKRDSREAVDCLIDQWNLRKSIFSETMNTRIERYELFTKLMHSFLKNFSFALLSETLLSFIAVFSNEIASRLLYSIRILNH